MSMKYGKELEASWPASAEEKAFRLEHIIYDLVHNGTRAPSDLLSQAECSNCVTELLQVKEAAYLVPYYNLVTEIRNHISTDNKHEFASFLVANRDLVRSYSPNEVLELLCWRSAVGCVAALLEDPHLIEDVDVNVIFDCDMTPLHMAALRSSYAMTDLLLHHGADPNIDDSSIGTPLDCALVELRGRAFESLTSQKSTLELISLICMPQLKERCGIVRLLAPHTNYVEIRCFQYMYNGAFLEYASLLIGAWDKLMISSGGPETTPVAQHISQVLTNASLQEETCQHFQLSEYELVKNLTLALDVVKTMRMNTGVLDCWGHSRVENVPMNGLSYKVTREHMKAAGSGESIQCLPNIFTSEAKELPKQNLFVEQGRLNQMLQSSTRKPKTKPTIGTPRFLPYYQLYSTFHRPETAQVKPSSSAQVKPSSSAQVKPSSSFNGIALTRVCASLMWYAKRMIK